MIIHITPRIYIPHRVEACELVSLEIAELGISLTQKELATRQPFPNKCMWVACRRIGRKAIAGILFTTNEQIKMFTSVSRWAIDGEMVVTHVTNYAVLDDKHDCVTDNMVLWYATSSENRKWDLRWPDWAKDLTPARAMPRMEIIGTGPGALPKESHRQDFVSTSGVIKERKEDFGMLTVEQERLTNGYDSDRTPSLAAAFVCNAR